jgi:hypothetical protein
LFTLVYSKVVGDWFLKEEGADRARRRFKQKSEALSAGVLRDLIGLDGGCVRVKNEAGEIEQELHFPAIREPRRR